MASKEVVDLNLPVDNAQRCLLARRVLMALQFGQGLDVKDGAPVEQQVPTVCIAVDQRVWRRQDDHGAAGPTHTPLPHRGDGQ